MGRKFRATEATGDTVNVRSNGQHMQCNYFCIHCHGIGRAEKHYPECTNHESYAVPATAEVPKRTASQRIWDIFMKQFVYPEPVGWWNYVGDSWWYKNVYQKELDKKDTP